MRQVIKVIEWVEQSVAKSSAARSAVAGLVLSRSVRRAGWLAGCNGCLAWFATKAKTIAPKKSIKPQ